MVNKPSYKDKTKIERFSFAVRLQGLFFPLGFGDIVQVLDHAGFTVAAPLKQTPLLPAGGQIVVAGRIAEKQDIKFNVEPDKGVVSLDGKTVDGVLSEFDAIEGLVLKEFAVDFKQSARFYEFVADLSISVDKNPIATIGKLFSDSKTISFLSTILKDEVGNYGVRLVKKGQTPNQEEWWEYRIEPLISKANTTYYCNVIYRSPDKTKVVDNAKGLIDKVEQLILAMERL